MRLRRPLSVNANLVPKMRSNKSKDPRIDKAFKGDCGGICGLSCGGLLGGGWVFGSTIMGNTSHLSDCGGLKQLFQTLLPDPSE